MDSLEVIQPFLEGRGHVFALRKVVKLHVDHCSIDALEGRGIADSTFYTFAGLCCVTAMNAPQANLTNNDCMFPTWSGSVYIALRSLKDFNVLCDKAKMRNQLGIRQCSSCLSTK